MRYTFIRAIVLAAVLGIGVQAWGTIYDIAVPNAETWKNDALSARSYGDTVRFSVPIIVNRNYGYGSFTGLTVSVRRIFSPTNQAVPLSAEYKTLLSLNSKAAFRVLVFSYIWKNLGYTVLLWLTGIMSKALFAILTIFFFNPPTNTSLFCG